MTLTYNATVTNGKLIISHKDRLLKELQGFEGKQLSLSIEKKKRSRSSQQNRYYWGVVIKIVHKGLIDAGWQPTEVDEDIVHDYLKYKFLLKEVVNVNTGEVITLNNTTKRLSTVEFMDYVAAIQQWAATYLSVFIPDPIDSL